MPIDPKVIYAAHIISGDKHNAADRARRVLLAQAECVSDGMVESAYIELEAVLDTAIIEDSRGEALSAIRDAIAAALRREAEK
jgi:hypothetical protein